MSRSRALPRGAMKNGGRGSDWIERLLAGLVLGGIAVVSAAICLIAAGLLDAGTLGFGGAMQDQLFGFADANLGTRLTVAGGSAAVGMIATGLFLGRLFGGSRASVGSHQYLLTFDEHGLITVASEAIASIAENAALRTRSVVEAEVRVRGKDSGPLRIRIDALVAPGADMPRTGNEVRNRARSAVEKMAGMEVQDVAVHLDVAGAQKWMELS